MSYKIWRAKKQSGTMYNAAVNQLGFGSAIARVAVALVSHATALPNPS